MVRAVVRLIDTHTHVHSAEFDGDREGVFDRARDAGVGTCIAVGTDLEDSRRAVALAASRPGVFATVGVHPHDAAGVTASTLHDLERLAGHERVVAFGEIGLDYYYEHSPKDVQRRRFVDQIAVANRLGLPLVIHTRDAWDETFRIVDDHPHTGGVFHCFTGGTPEAEQAIERGFFLSFSGIVTFNKAHAIQDAARWVPLDRLLIETDCPFLSPVPNRGRRNEPAFVTLVAQKVAELRGVSPESLALASYENAHRCFPRLSRVHQPP